MNIFQNIIDGTKNKMAEAKEKREFLAMVEEKAKPIRRKGYFEQVLKDSMAEGIALAHSETEKRMQKTKKKTPEDFGIGEAKKKPEVDQWAFLDNLGLGEPNPKPKIEHKPKKQLEHKPKKGAKR